MARLPALIDDLAEHDTRGRPTVELIARNIREAGLIRTTKRGRGAAEMTAEDASALLIGLCVAETPSAAPDAVRTFQVLKPENSHAADTGQKIEELPPPLSQVTGAADLGLAVAALLDGSVLLDRLGTLTAHNLALSFLARGERKPEPSQLMEFQLNVRFRLVSPQASISARWADDRSGTIRFFGRSFFSQSTNGKGTTVGSVDRDVEVSLGEATFIRVGALLRPPPPPAAPESPV